MPEGAFLTRTTGAAFARIEGAPRVEPSLSKWLRPADASCAEASALIVSAGAPGRGCDSMTFT
ncbi:MAG TPA: hypothetical protein VMR43_12625 [Variovorax sp.]|nr:hypothetical protein [Variovorax sp.]